MTARVGSQEVQAYLRTRCAELLAAPNFMDVLPGMIYPDDSLAERTQLIAERIRVLAGERFASFGGNARVGHDLGK